MRAMVSASTRNACASSTETLPLGINAYDGAKYWYRRAVHCNLQLNERGTLPQGVMGREFFKAGCCDFTMTYRIAHYSEYADTRR